MQRLVLSSLLLMAVAACAPGQPSGETPPDPRPAQSTVFDATRLPAFHWTLTDATAADGARIDALFPRADKPLQLDFADGRVSVSNACNHIGGRYALDGATLVAGDLQQTLMACIDEALMQSDTAISERLRAGGALHFDGEGALVLTTPAGDRLRFSAIPTAATKYDDPGEQVFLEVASQRVPCHHPLIPDYRCLHVREIVYGDNGLKQSQGEWQLLYQDIEGYTHEPGTRNVLRVGRYRVAKPPADGSSIAYVLDMVVESEMVGR